MITFPARKIIDMRVYDKFKGEPEPILYHNEDYDTALTNDEIERYNIRFNLYDIERKVYITKENDFSEIREYMRSEAIKKVRLETIADAKIIPLYDYNNIWETL